jgi:hypothetical protein
MNSTSHPPRIQKIIEALQGATIHDAFAHPSHPGSVILMVKRMDEDKFVEDKGVLLSIEDGEIVLKGQEYFRKAK